MQVAKKTELKDLTLTLLTDISFPQSNLRKDRQNLIYLIL